MRAERHMALVERVLLGVARHWPALVAGGWVDLGDGWRRSASQWTPERVEAALDAMALADRPLTTPGQLLAATRPAAGPTGTVPASQSNHPALVAERRRGGA